MKKYFFALLLLVSSFVLTPVRYIHPQDSETVEKTLQLELKKIGGELCLFQNGIPFPSYEKQDLHREFDLQGTWKKQRVEADHDLSLEPRGADTVKKLEEESKGMFRPDYDDSAWQDFAVPGIENPAPDRYQGCAWYRRNFELPKDFSGSRVLLRCESANYVADAWINGKWAGSHEGGYTPFVMDVSSLLKKEGKNFIAVRVDNISWIPHKVMKPQDREANKKNIVPYKTCDWWNPGGITRDIYLQSLPGVCVSNAAVKLISTAEEPLKAKAVIYLQNNTAEDADVQVTCRVLNARITDGNILEMNAKKIADFDSPCPVEAKEFRQALKKKELYPLAFEFSCKDLKPWSPEAPVLYVLNVTVKKGGAVVDDYYTQFGCRTVKVDGPACRLLLNGKPIFLRGVARHEVYPGTSGEICEGIKGIYEDLLIIKDANIDFLRTAHYPNHPATYILADRVGIAVWEEIPMFWFDGPQFDYQRLERKTAKQMWLEMVFRDYNRPGILFWSTCNESTKEDKVERAAYIKDMKASADAVDGSRLTVQSACGDDTEDTTHSECDLVGFTCYYGIFYGKDYYSDTLEAMEKYHKLYPEKPILITEFGIWSEWDFSNAANQMEVAADTFDAYRKCDYICGTVWWAAFNWHTMITEPQTMGLVTWDRKTYKPVYFLLQRIYGNLLEDYSLSMTGPSSFDQLTGKIGFEGKINGQNEKLSAVFDGKDILEATLSDNKFSIKIDTTAYADGPHTLIVKSKSIKGTNYWDFYNISVDNRDDFPVVEAVLKDGDSIATLQNFLAYVRDDRGIAKVVLKDDLSGKESEMTPLGFDAYQLVFDASQYEDGHVATVHILATDTGGNTADKVLKLTVDKQPGIACAVPFNFDWIAGADDRRNANDFYNFPAECLPPSNAWFIFNGTEKMKFRFPVKEGEEFNCMECYGQEIEAPPGKYSKIYVLAASHNANMVNNFTLEYADGTKEEKQLFFSDWWTGNNNLSEQVALKCPYHNEVGDKKVPPVAIYAHPVDCNPQKELKKIIFPVNDLLHVFAISLKEKKED
jgi:hypothetical protein